MSVVVVLEAIVKPGKKETLLKRLSEVLPETRKYPGFVSIEINTRQNKDEVFFYEKWKRFEDYESYLAWRTETGLMSELGAMFAALPSIRYFHIEDV